MVFLEDAEVLKNVRVADGIHELACRAPQIAGEGKPGQFVHMTVSPHRSTISSPLLRRPFSFYGVNAEAGTVSILYRIRGLGTSLLAEARPGEHLSMLGPLGTGFTLPSAESPVFPVESTVPPMKSCASPVENAASPQEKAFSKVEKGVLPAKSTVLLVGGGMGIAPLVYLADSKVCSDGPVFSIDRLEFEAGEGERNES